MKRFFIVSLVFLLIGALIAEMMLYDNGLVLIAFGQHQISMSVWVALFFWVVSLLFIILLFAFLKKIGVNSPKKSTKLSWWQMRSRRNKHQHLQAMATQGFIEYLEGNWQESIKHLLPVAEESDIPVVFYLIAAHAAFESHDSEKSQQLLVKVKPFFAKHDIAFGITEARFSLLSHHWEKALALLQHLREQAPKNRYILQLLTRIYHRLNDWTQLYTLLPELQKKAVFDKEKLADLEIEIHRNLFKKLADMASKQIHTAENNVSQTSYLAELQQYWRKTPQAIKLHSDILLSYVRALLQLQATKQAEHVLHEALHQHWDDQWIKMYGMISHDSSKNAIEFIERQLKNHPKNPNVLLTLGRLYLQLPDLEKARVHFEMSLQLCESRETTSELAKLFARMGDVAKSNEYFLRAEHPIYN